jgi:type 1 glutamine amidotransferase
MNGDPRSRRDFLKTVSAAAVGAALGAAAERLAAAAAVGAASRPAGAKLRAVLWVGGHSHDFKAYAETLTKALPEQVPMDIEVVKDGKFLDAPEADKLDVIIMNHCFAKATGVLTDAQKAKLLELIRGGVGVVGIHASYYSFTEWADIRKVWGATFTKHGKVDVTLAVTILDKEHPVTQGVGDSFEVRSELYQSTPLAADCRVLAKAKEKDKDGEYPSVWTRTEGKGRVAVIMPAHWPDAYKVPAFVKLIANAARWASRGGDAKSGQEQDRGAKR